jgi:nucleotide-binding universal stress UspA family protein
MTTSVTKPIVIGYDGSPGADRALHWALHEGKVRGLPVYVVEVLEWPVNVPPTEAGWLVAGELDQVKTGLDRAVTRAGGGAESVSVVEGSVVGTLCTHSAHAAMLVLGERGVGTFAGLLVGSVSMAVATHAACTVVVVRGEERRAERLDDLALPVVVGVDDSPQSRDAAAFAFAEARARGCHVVVARAWRPDGDPSGEWETAERYALRQTIAPVAQDYPDVRWSMRLFADRPSKAMIEASRDAQMIVVGNRGRGGFAGLRLGSVAHQLLHHAHSPVAIVR